MRNWSNVAMVLVMIVVAVIQAAQAAISQSADLAKYVPITSGVWNYVPLFLLITAGILWIIGNWPHRKDGIFTDRLASQRMVAPIFMGAPKIGAVTSTVRLIEQPLRPNIIAVRGEVGTIFDPFDMSTAEVEVLLAVFQNAPIADADIAPAESVSAAIRYEPSQAIGANTQPMEIVNGIWSKALNNSNTTGFPVGAVRSLVLAALTKDEIVAVEDLSDKDHAILPTKHHFGTVNASIKWIATVQLTVDGRVDSHKFKFGLDFSPFPSARLLPVNQ